MFDFSVHSQLGYYFLVKKWNLEDWRFWLAVFLTSFIK